MRSLIALFFISCWTTIFGQEKLWLKQTKVSEAIALEMSITPNVKFLKQNVSMSKDYYPLADKYQVINPIIAQREALNYLPVYAEYFYTPEDSILRLVAYNWEKNMYGNFFDKQKLWKEESKKFEKYNGEYERIRNNLITQLGIPNSTDTTARIVDYDQGKYLRRETLWKTDEIDAKLYMIFESVTYKVDFVLYWKK